MWANSYSLSILTDSNGPTSLSNLEMNIRHQHLNEPRSASSFRSDHFTRATKVIPNPKARLLDQVREVLRVKHYAIRTEEVYIHWIKRYIFFHQKRHPREMGAPEVQAFLSDLAVNQMVSASTQNQTLNALVFLYVIPYQTVGTPKGEMPASDAGAPSAKMTIGFGLVSGGIAHRSGTQPPASHLSLLRSDRILHCEMVLAYLRVRGGRAQCINDDGIWFCFFPVVSLPLGPRETW
jgi:hypothetical protein